MKQYDRVILNHLLDSYENSLLFTGENQNQIHISFSFTRKIMPEYFSESSMAYEDIHACVRELENRGFVQIVWKKGKENHILQKVILQEMEIAAVYQYLGRCKKADKIMEAKELLLQCLKEYNTPICRAFLKRMYARLEENKSIKAYLDIYDSEKAGRLISALYFIEENENECYVREFSILHFGDSKCIEGMLGTIGKIIKEENNHFANMNIYDILAEYSIYHTPNYVYFKGNGTVQFEGDRIHLQNFSNGIGIPGEAISSMQLLEAQDIQKVITIENQTTFFGWKEKNAIIIYLGGYHNEVRRKLLQVLYAQLPSAKYLHFGDIDCGGFEIYEDLCRKSGISFETYHMDLPTLKQYEQYAKPLTENDRKRIQQLQLKKQTKEPKFIYQDVLDYMLQKNIKLEQECIICKSI